MTGRETLYKGASCAAWGYLFLYLDINLGAVSILPAFVGYILFFLAIGRLSARRRDLALLRLLSYPTEFFGDAWGYAAMALAAVGVFVGLCLMAALFALRKLFREHPETLE